MDRTSATGVLIMSMRSLENAILDEAKTVLKNNKLKRSSIIEWNTGDIKPQENEVTVFLPKMGVNLTVLKTDDKRQ
jgi:hypothetical protein